MPDTVSSRSHRHALDEQSSHVLALLGDDVPEVLSWSRSLAALREAAAREQTAPGLTIALAYAAIDLALATLQHGATSIATRVLSDAIDLVAAIDVAESPLERGEAIQAIAEELLALHALLGDREGALATLERSRLALLSVGTDA